MPEGFARGFQGNLVSQVKIALRIETPGGSQAMDVWVVGKIIAKGVDT